MEYLLFRGWEFNCKGKIGYIKKKLNGMLQAWALQHPAGRRIIPDIHTYQQLYKARKYISRDTAALLLPIFNQYSTDYELSIQNKIVACLKRIQTRKSN